MKYTVEAYDVLVFKLKQEIKELQQDNDDRSGVSATIILGLLDFIVKHCGKYDVYEIASKFDKQFPKE